MKITVNRKELERELAIAKKVIGRPNSLMICQSVLLSFYENGIAIQSTDLSKAYMGVIGDPLYNYWIPDNSDQIVISLDRFMRVVKAISKKTTEVSLEFTQEDQGLLVNGTTTIVASASADDYPYLPKFPASTQYNLFMYDGLNQVNSLKGDRDDKRMHIQCLYADTQNGRLASTDGSRLYLSKIPVTESLKPFMIEKDAVDVLCTPQLRNHIGPVRIKDNNLFFDTEKGYLSVRIPDGEFPDCGFLIEMFSQDPGAVVSVSDKHVVIDAINEAQGILSDQYRGIMIDINGHVIISATNPDYGEFKKDISRDVTIYLSEEELVDNVFDCTKQLQNHIGYLGKPLSLALNPAYVIDVCKQIPDVGINFLFPGADSPMLIESAMTDFRAAIMPMRV